MVVLTLLTKTNGESFSFQEAIPKVYFMKIVSCSLYNSWHNLKNRGTVTFKHKDNHLMLMNSCLATTLWNTWKKR